MIKKTVLVTDGGGRGSVLVKKYLQSKSIGRVLAVPGNDLMLIDKNVQIFPDTKTTDTKQILKICKDQKVDLIDVAQDDAVAVGVTDILVKNRFKVFGPTKAAGQIEWDKSWSKYFMKRNNIPTAKYNVFKSEAGGINFINRQKNSTWYVKASGLAAGKGAIFAKDNKDAINAIKQMKIFGKAGETYVIEECLQGEEFSSFAAVSGKHFVILGHAQDHKTVFNNNLGPNTGGMGCSSPPLAITPTIEKQVQEIFQKTVNGLVKAKRPYLGILYLGGIIDKKGKVKVIEFNARWGDPEAQVIIPSIKNDFFELANLVVNGKIKKLKIKKDNLYRVAIAATSKGYPIDYKQVVGKKIFGLEKILKIKNIQVFGAGVKKSGENFLASGGRLFYILAADKNIAQAREKAYNALSLVSISGGNLHYRQDIGYRDVERKNDF